MVNILGIIAILLLGGSVFLSLENKQKFQDSVSVKETEEKQLQQSQDKLEAARAQIEESEATQASISKEVESLIKSEDSLSQIKSIEESIEEIKLEISDKKKELADKEEEVADLKGVEELFNDVKKHDQEKQEILSEIINAEAKRASAESRSTSLQNQIVEAKKVTSFYSKRTSDSRLKTSVGRVYNDLGFVTLNGGDNSGIVKGSSLQVLRNGEKVADLVVTTVEPNSSSADIISSSDQPVHIHAGDTVVAK